MPSGRAPLRQFQVEVPKAIVAVGQVTIPVQAIRSLLAAVRHHHHLMTLMLMMKATDHSRRTTLRPQEDCQEVHEDREAHRVHQALQVHLDYQERTPSRANLAAWAPEAPQGRQDPRGHLVPQDLQFLWTPQLDLPRNQDRPVLTSRKE